MIQGHSPRVKMMIACAVPALLLGLGGPASAQNWGALGNILGATGQIVEDDYNNKQANYWNEQGRQALRDGDPVSAEADFTRSLGYRDDPNVRGNLIIAQRAQGN